MQNLSELINLGGGNQWVGFGKPVLIECSIIKGACVVLSMSMGRAEHEAASGYCWVDVGKEVGFIPLIRGVVGKML